jgi:hypothetical protein
MKRLKAAWLALRGHYIKVPERIYVYSDGDPRRWVQLLNYQDRILALDGEGTIWIVAEDYGGSNMFHTQILIESPRRY